MEKTEATAEGIGIKELANEMAEDTRCSICHEDYKDPRYLPCHHSFCRVCLDQYAKSIKLGNVLACPECRVEVSLPLDTEKLPSAFETKKLQSFVHHCQRALHKLESEKVVSKTNDSVYTCCNHCKSMTLFCLQCNKLICEDCKYSTDHKNHERVCEPIGKAALFYRKLLHAKCQQLKDAKAESTKPDFASNFVVQREAITKQAENLTAEVIQSFDEMIDTLHHRKEELIKKILDLKESKLASLRNQECSINAVLTSTNETILKINDSLNNVSDFEFLNNIIIQQLPSTIEMHQSSLSALCWEPKEIADVYAKITCVHDVKELCQSKVAVFASQIEEGSRLAVAEVGEPCTFMISSQCPSLAVVSAALTSVQGNVATPVTVKRISRSSTLYKATYIPQVRGRHHLMVTIDGKPNVCSPIDVCVYPKMTTERTSDYSLNIPNPTCIAINSKGQLVVSSSSRNRVDVYTKTGKRLFELNGHNLSFPYGVAVDKDDSIFVAEETAHVVSKFSRDGKFIKSFGRKGVQQEELDSPKGVKVIYNRVYVCDQKNSRIQVLSTDLEHVSTIIMAFQAAIDVTLGAQGSLYVAGPQSIQVYNIKDFANQTPIQHNDFHMLSGICFDALRSTVYAVDFFNCCVIQLTHTGRYVESFCSKGKMANQLMNPSGIVVDLDGYVYVCDSGNNRILVF